jgi:hypothetical protein
MGRGHVYLPELRQRAVRIVAEVRPEYPSDWPAMVDPGTEPGQFLSPHGLAFDPRDDISSEESPIRHGPHYSPTYRRLEPCQRSGSFRGSKV